MTKDEILTQWDAMTPRERDAWIAEIVMSWVAWEEKRGEYLHVTFQKPGDREPYRSERNWEKAATRYRQISFSEIDYHKHIVHGMRDFSTEISAAWEVVEKMSKTYFSEMAMTELEDGAWGWMARFILVLNDTYTVNSYRATAKTASEAICKAALRAVMGL